MKKMLNILIMFTIFTVTFFSLRNNINAANFKYSEFNWEKLLEQNKNYWVSGCEDGDEKCSDRIIKYQKGFYERLYKILAHYQDKENITIDDKIIIETSFYGITPDSFKDPEDDKENPYNIGDDDATNYVGSTALNDGAAEYFKNEEDSLKTLINNMVSYKEPCYGISSETPVKNEETGAYTCSGEFKPDGNRCVALLDNLNVTFSEGLLRKFDIFGFYESDNEAKCQEMAKSYSNYELGDMSNELVLDEDSYWEYLINSDYFDKKSHLRSHFSSILDETGHSNMSELSKEEYEKYREQIKLIRTSMVEYIKSQLKFYNLYASDVSMSNSYVAPSYWWPIGSTSTTTNDGVTFASEEPESLEILTKYGNVTTSNGTEMHNGLDIKGNDATTKVIATRDGTIIALIDGDGGQCTNGDVNCGDGYGNYIIIQHDDGNYSLYAHLANGSIKVKNGDKVKQGQVIANVGSTGNATSPHLHFEIRVGGNDPTSAQDPLNFISVENPRGGVGQIIIPNEFGNAGFFTYTQITKFNWVYDQKKVYDLWVKSGAKSKNHIAVIDDRYLIACTTTFGNIGDKIDFYLGDGTKIETIMFDAKAQVSVPWDRNPANMWGHHKGQQILEFEITHNPNGSGDVGTWTGWSGKRVASATNLGQNVIGKKSGGIASNANSVNNNTGKTNSKGNSFVNGVTYMDGILIVNKTYSIPANYVPTNTYKPINGISYCDLCLDKETYEQFLVMQKAAKAQGLKVYVSSGYRSYSLQSNLYKNSLNNYSKQRAEAGTARPGHSEHQTGLAMDLNNIGDGFINTKEGKWVNSNCYKYGFIIRYPKGKTDKTGYKYEPWHIRYVGVDLATKLYNKGNWITLEEHFNITSKYSN